MILKFSTTVMICKLDWRYYNVILIIGQLQTDEPVIPRNIFIENSKFEKDL